MIEPKLIVVFWEWLLKLTLEYESSRCRIADALFKACHFVATGRL